MATTKTYTLSTYTLAWAGSGETSYGTSTFTTNGSRSQRPLYWIDFFNAVRTATFVDLPNDCYAVLSLDVHGRIGNDSDEQRYTLTATTTGTGVNSQFAEWALYSTDSAVNSVSSINANPSITMPVYTYMVYTFRFYHSDGSNYIVDTVNNRNYYSINLTGEHASLTYNEISETIGTTTYYYVNYTLAKINHTGSLYNLYDTLTIEASSSAKAITISPRVLSATTTNITGTTVTLIPDKINGSNIPSEISGDVIRDFTVSRNNGSNTAVAFGGTDLGIGITYKISAVKSGYVFYGSNTRAPMPTVTASTRSITQKTIYGEASTSNTRLHHYYVYLVEDNEYSYPVTSKPAISTIMSYINFDLATPYPFSFTVKIGSNDIYRYGMNYFSAGTLNGFTYSASSMSNDVRYYGACLLISVANQSKTEPLPILFSNSGSTQSGLTIQFPRMLSTSSFQIAPNVNCTYEDAYSANGYYNVFFESSSTTVNNYAVCLGVSKIGKYNNRMASLDDLARRIAGISSYSLYTQSVDGDACESVYETYTTLLPQLKKISRSEIFNKNSSPLITSSGNCENRIITKNEKITSGYTSSNVFRTKMSSSIVNFFNDWDWSSSRWPAVCPSSLGTTQACKVTDLLKDGNIVESDVPEITTIQVVPETYTDVTYVDVQYQLETTGNRTIVETGIQYSLNEEPTNGSRTLIFGTKHGSEVTTNPVTARISTDTTASYYYQAYCIDAQGNEFYGRICKFQVYTNISTVEPSIILTSFTYPFSTSHYCGQVIGTMSGGSTTIGSTTTQATINEARLEFSLDPTFHEIDFTTSLTAANGGFTATTNNLSTLGTYYVRGYINTSIGAAYSNELNASFTGSNSTDKEAKTLTKNTSTNTGTYFFSYYVDEQTKNHMTGNGDVVMDMTIFEGQMSGYTYLFSDGYRDSLAQAQNHSTQALISQTSTYARYEMYNSSNFYLVSSLMPSDMNDMFMSFFSDKGSVNIPDIKFVNLVNAFGPRETILNEIEIDVVIKLLVLNGTTYSWVILLPENHATSGDAYISMKSTVNPHGGPGVSYATVKLTIDDWVGNDTFQKEGIKGLYPYNFTETANGITIGNINDTFTSILSFKFDTVFKSR